MKEFNYTITDPEGIHARPAGELVKVAKGFASSIKLAKDGKEGDCKRIFGIMGQHLHKQPDVIAAVVFDNKVLLQHIARHHTF